MVDDVRRTGLREHTGWGEPRDRPDRAAGARGPPVEVHEHIGVDPERPVQVNEFVEVAEPRVTQPIEVHEHIAVQERAVPPRTRRVANLADEQLVESWNRTQLYHDFLAGRRRRRFTAASLLVFGLAVLTTIWVLAGLGGVGVVLPSVALDAAQSMSVLSILVLVVGTVLAYGAARGNLGALVLGWLAGAALVALPMLVTPFGADAAMLALAGVITVVALGVVLVCTLALASWHGERVQRRFLGGPPPVRGVL